MPKRTEASQPAKMLDIMKEMSQRLLLNPEAAHSSEAAHVALFFANSACNECVGQAKQFTLLDWDYLGGERQIEAEAAGDPMRKERLSGIFARIEGLLAAYYTDEEPE